MLKYNPFKPGLIIHPSMFAGRIDEILEIENALFQTQNGNPAHFLIHGERGIGKSSLLLYANYLATGKFKSPDNDITFNFLTININLEPSDTYKAIIRKLAQELKLNLDNNQALKKQLKDILNFISNFEAFGIKYNKDTTSSEFLLEELSHKLAAIAKSMSKDKQGIFIFIDEADKPSSEAGLGLFVKGLSERLTKLEANNVGIGIVGISEVINKMRESHASSVRIFRQMELSVLLANERKEVVSLGLADAREKNGFYVSINDEALSLISSLSEGYPHFIQQYAYSAFNADDDNKIDETDVIYGLKYDNGALNQLGMQYFENMYTEELRSDDYRTVLQVIAQHSPNYAQRKTIINESGLKGHTVDNALTALKKRGSVIAIRGQQGQYKLPSHSFAAWILAFKVAKKKEQDYKGI